MGSLRTVPILLLLAGPALAHTYGVGRAPTAAELRQDITISPTGVGIPPGHGTAAEGKVLFTQKNCVVCHGPGAAGGGTAYQWRRRVRASCGISSIAACLSGMRGHLPPMRYIR